MYDEDIYIYSSVSRYIILQDKTSLLEGDFFRICKTDGNDVFRFEKVDKKIATQIRLDVARSQGTLLFFESFRGTVDGGILHNESF